ncbi:MAG: GNAT family protein [Longimicrobiales bacterium]
MDELRREAAARVETFADEHGIRPADRLHWALTSTIDRMTGKVWSAQEAEADVGDPDAFRFRPWTGDDVEIYTELLGNPRVWEYLPEPFPGPFTEETARTLIEVGAFEFHHEAVAVEFGGEPIGQCLLRFDRAAGGVRTAEVAYWLGESHWGRGHMGRILPLFTRRSFEGHDLDIIYAWIHRDHEASARVAQRAGYRRDTFPLESELAETLGRPAFVRYSVTRPEGG